MRVIQNIVIGGAVLFVGFVLYPLYINLVYTPLYDLLMSWFPGLPAEQEIFWKAMPFIVLFAIIGTGIMWIAGRKGLSGGGEAASNSEGK